MKKAKTNPTATILIITLGFLVVYLITKMEWALFVALGVGVLGALSKFIAKQIDFVWMKLAKVLSFIVPNILLSIIFFFLLFPIALLSRIFGKKDAINLKNTKASLFIEKPIDFTKESFEKPW